ncbi:hypothetical protein BV20DRAFT_740402 [Pilatotrama ljubarskyi]|nr:hypothetical protein BV20DRAFT_740402 [Pilatotrama ljubarskyi]
MEYNLNVTIDSNILPTLVDAHYKLCIAKKVNGAYTVVWQGNNVLFSNDFTWTANYQVFGTNKFTAGALVQARTESQTIYSGQTALLDKYGIMRPATGGKDSSGKFAVQNEYGLINIGVNSLVNGEYTPSYVSPNPLVTGRTALQPIETVLVWFDTSVTTGTMMLHASSDAIEIDFTSVPTHKLAYRTPVDAPPGKGVWVLDGAQAVLPMTYNLLSNSFEIPEPDASVLSLMTELINSPPSAGASPVELVATVDFQHAEDARDYWAYAAVDSFSGQGFTKWVASRVDATVTVNMEFDAADEDDEAATRLAITKYLQVQYGNSAGKRYKTLNLSVAGQLVFVPQPGWSAERPSLTNEKHEHSTGVAVVRFSDHTEAKSFAQQVNEATSRGASFEATARGPAVTVKFSVKGNKDGAQKRIRQAYDAAIASFESMPQGAEPVYVGPIVWDQ